jgi:hypothetical protein
MLSKDKYGISALILKGHEAKKNVDPYTQPLQTPHLPSPFSLPFCLP